MEVALGSMPLHHLKCRHGRNKGHLAAAEEDLVGIEEVDVVNIEVVDVVNTEVVDAAAVAEATTIRITASIIARITTIKDRPNNMTIIVVQAIVCRVDGLNEVTIAAEDIAVIVMAHGVMEAVVITLVVEVKVTIVDAAEIIKSNVKDNLYQLYNICIL